MESQCYEVQHIVDPLDPSKITCKWLLVGKATTDHDVIDDEDDHWTNLFWDGENLRLEGGNSTFNWSVREVEVRGPKIIHKETGAFVTLIPTCMDCVLMKSEMSNKKTELYFFTRSGTLTESEIKKFKANARCLHLPNVHVYERAKPHIHNGSECDSMRHILDVFVPNKVQLARERNRG
ncbi:hypothetical protein NDU88_000979 [Pleurodeles waltl]|uniref:Uncharacterized protein n=1 Tax=Pleurodeles waltl TaxID=8319 RepID=A0AAV7Q2C2_PLEWA|nr:hypothetical protein NDU88_000979 [Pleurodeles waltl]